MKEVITRCDICGEPSAGCIGLNVDRRMDAAGSMEDEYEYRDLCLSHALVLLGEAANVSYESAQRMLDRITSIAAVVKKVRKNG